MARTDLLYDVKAGDIVLEPSYPDDSEIIDLTYDDGYLVGVPANVFTSGKTVYAKIPFVESGNAIKVKKTETVIGGGGIRPIGMGSMETTVYGAVMEGTDKALMMCNLPFISLDVFSIKFDSSKNKVIIGDGKKYDLKIGEAKEQNTMLLAICNKGNNYRYPNSGVGVNRFVNSHLSSSELAREIVTQFNNDSVIVVNASFDKDTGKLNIETKES